MPDRPTSPATPERQAAAPRGAPPAREPAARAGVRVLVCDHRGEGSQSRARVLTALGYSVEISSTLRGTLELLSQGSPALIVLDPLSGAGQAELEVIDRARRSDRSTALLAIVEDDGPVPTLLAALRPEEYGPVDLLRRGSADDELCVRVELLLRRLDTQREMERLRHLATHDDRTDLLRPQVFQDQLRQHFSASQRHDLNMALLLIDLDDFGRVNKVYDHTVGDAVITHVGAAIRRALRAEDVAARLGGDEFSVLLPYTGKVDAARVVQRLLEQIRESSKEVKATPPLKVTASLGFETFSGKDLESVERLRLHAEEALRAAKRAGGDRGVYYRSLDTALRGTFDPSADQ